jgi:small subunit ribosomal protein S18
MTDFNNNNSSYNQERTSTIIPNSVLFNRKGPGSNRPKCPLSGSDSQEAVDYKDLGLLLRFTSEKGKIFARRLTGVCASKQRELKRAIKIARILALLPFSSTN